MRISDWSSDVCSSDLRVVDRWIGITHRSKSLPVPQLDRKEPERHRAFARHARLPARFFPVRSTALSPTALLAVRPGGRKPIPECSRRVTTRSEEHTSELQSLMRISYAVFCLKKKKKQQHHN